jgi:hypothetical protein
MTIHEYHFFLMSTIVYIYIKFNTMIFNNINIAIITNHLQQLEISSVQHLYSLKSSVGNLDILITKTHK